MPTTCSGSTRYDGGAVVLHALRREIGDDAFFTLLQRWVAENAGTSRTTADFIALADEVAGRDLTAFFDDWLFASLAAGDVPRLTRRQCPVRAPNTRRHAAARQPASRERPGLGGVGARRRRCARR